MRDMTGTEGRADWVARRGFLGLATLAAIAFGFAVFGVDDRVQTAALESCQVDPTGAIRACSTR